MLFFHRCRVRLCGLLMNLYRGRRRVETDMEIERDMYGRRSREWEIICSIFHLSFSVKLNSGTRRSYIRLGGRKNRELFIFSYCERRTRREIRYMGGGSEGTKASRITSLFSFILFLCCWVSKLMYRRRKIIRSG